MAAFGLGMKRLTHKHPSGVSETLRSQTIRCSEERETHITIRKKVEIVNNREVPPGSEIRLRLVRTLNK